MQKRVNIGLDEKIHTQAKGISALKRISLNDYFRKAIEDAIERDKKNIAEILK
ncbi:MAG: hypothetical protein ABH879_07210 [archaeon]